jgi:ELWxxDGT repeat protein
MSRIFFEGIDSQGRDELYITDNNGNIKEVFLTGADPNGAVINGGNLGNTVDAIGPIALSFDGYIYLRAADNQDHGGLFVYQESLAGAAGGKELDGAIGANDYGLDPADFVQYYGKVYFNGDDSNNNRGLWVTDGTTAGTKEITAPQSSPSPSSPDYMTVYKNVLYMDGGGALWSYNSKSPANADPFIRITGTGFDPTELTVADEGTYTADPFTGKSNILTNPPQDLYMSGVDGKGKDGLFVYNGSGSPTEVYAGSASGGINPNDMQSLGTQTGTYVSGAQFGVFFKQNGVIFSGVDDNNRDRGLWVSDGTTGGTKEIAKSSAFGASDLDPFDITVDGGAIYFTANDGGPGRGLFVYVPSLQNTVEVIKSSQYDLTDNYNPNDAFNENPTTMSVVNGNLYFGATPASGGSAQLYELGANNNAILVKNSPVGPTSVGATDPHA